MFWPRWYVDDSFAPILCWSNCIRILCSSLSDVRFRAKCPFCPNFGSWYSELNRHRMGSSFFRWGIIDSWIWSMDGKRITRFLHPCLWWTRELRNKNTWDWLLQWLTSLSDYLLCLCHCLQLGRSKLKWKSLDNSHLRHLLSNKLNSVRTWNRDNSSSSPLAS